MKRLLLLILPWIAACTKQPVRPVSAASEPSSTVVATALAHRSEMDKRITVTGELVPFQEVEVMAKVAGYVQRITVDVGDAVRQGQVLAVLEIPEMKDDLTRASATIERSRADVDRATRELERAQQAQRMTNLTYTRLASVFKSRPGLVAQQEVDDAMAKDQIAESQVNAARSALASAREQTKVGEADRGKAETLLQYTRVTAPFDGVVTKRYANQGAMIQAGVASQSQAMPVVRLSQNSLLRLVLNVPESVAGSIKPGSAVSVKVPSLDREFSGRVSRTSDRVSTATRTMHTEVDVPNPARELIPGMYAEVTLRLEHRPDALTVPLEAVAREGEKSSVMVVGAGGRVEGREVITGLESPKLIEIASGLHEGDEVILGARGQIKPGQVVRTKRVAGGN